MRFFFSGELDSAVSDQYLPISREVERLLNEQLGGKDYGTALTTIAIIPMILSPKFSQGRKERRLIQHRQRAADYRLFIDYEAWNAGSTSDRRQLLINNVLTSVADIHRKLKRNFYGKLLYEDIRHLFSDAGHTR